MENYKTKDGKWEFRVSKSMGALDLLALCQAFPNVYALDGDGRSSLDLSSPEKIAAYEAFCGKIFECIEAKVGEAWFPLKAKGRDDWTPEAAKADPTLLNALYAWFVMGEIVPVFQKPSE